IPANDVSALVEDLDLDLAAAGRRVQPQLTGEIGQELGCHRAGAVAGVERNEAVLPDRGKTDGAAPSLVLAPHAISEIEAAVIDLDGGHVDERQIEGVHHPAVPGASRTGAENGEAISIGAVPVHAIPAADQLTEYRSVVPAIGDPEDPEEAEVDGFIGKHTEA